MKLVQDREGGGQTRHIREEAAGDRYAILKKSKPRKDSDIQLSLENSHVQPSVA